MIELMSLWRETPEISLYEHAQRRAPEVAMKR